MSIFKDYPHSNVHNKDRRFIEKTLTNKRVLEKEYVVMRFLSMYGMVPRVYDLNGKSFKEEIIPCLPACVFDDNLVQLLAKYLKRLHTLKIPDDVREKTKDSFVKDSRYLPTKILKAILKHLDEETRLAYGPRLLGIALEVDDYLAVQKYRVSLIHGDLNLGNIFILEDRVIVTDWTDARIDIASCDIAQLFYLLQFTPEQEDLFLATYKEPYITNKLILFHKLLLFAYDIAHFHIDNRPCPPRYHTGLKSCIRKFHAR